MAILAPRPKYSAIASWALVSSEAVSRSRRLKVNGWGIFAALMALLMSSTASSTAEIQSLLALTPVRGNIAPATMATAGVVGPDAPPPRPPKATGTSRDRAAPSMENFLETERVAGVDSWLMPAK